MPSGSVSGGSGNKKTGAKSSKAIQAAKKQSRGSRGVPSQRQIPWVMIGGVALVVLLIAVIAVSIVPKYQNQQEMAAWSPSESNQDPSSAIDGVVTVDYEAGQHVDPAQRVAYDYSPPFGGPHDSVWATCTGTVYDQPVRTENMVHSLEHGAVWIAYNPDLVDDAARDALAGKVDGRTYTMMSPYPGLDSPISLQSWGHQLKVDSADDERIDQFIASLRLNQYAYPEVGASCSTLPASFDPANPPPFDASEPGPDAVPMDGGTVDGTEQIPAGGAGQFPTDMQVPAGS
ncbi:MULTISPECIES: DUF3105 domain-containing protein [unclassified Rhodococcus (in: high G+C Gram-positive bacteria)]|uniref:DUF3105 domain-containing protein n=1 Tax=unclassified Rhodococcus (in: high G+C Gram-positive bacteria) TaxID=192944 RepID=UPI001469DCED|nr:MULTISPECIES: DUF3105 domain-containing protein [unclassified Rhodococcus (in: high G+C Gram-positive bacteria)]MBF0661362.1 DUF3105 domain-containing protein [Rhodococcus sp. (in: high G+C Gram-positive bacteria)]NMD97202.1 DUF3105 domain-containing protein [Rhodococcus sp. BL-253-APC-6A1W]NME80481.1 DUF3105 domain-containing protein [Rhodococcus sp. 105337]